MGWKIGTIVFGVTTVGFGFLSALSLICGIETHGETKAQKEKVKALERIIDIQNKMLGEM